MKGKSVSCLDKTCQDPSFETTSSSENEVNTDSEETLNVIEEAFDDLKKVHQ